MVFHDLPFRTVPQNLNKWTNFPIAPGETLEKSPFYQASSSCSGKVSTSTFGVLVSRSNIDKTESKIQWLRISDISFWLLVPVSLGMMTLLQQYLACATWLDQFKIVTLSYLLLPNFPIQPWHFNLLIGLLRLSNPSCEALNSKNCKGTVMNLILVLSKWRKRRVFTRKMTQTKFPDLFYVNQYVYVTRNLVYIYVYICLIDEYMHIYNTRKHADVYTFPESSWVVVERGGRSWQPVARPSKIACWAWGIKQPPPWIVSGVSTRRILPWDLGCFWHCWEYQTFFPDTRESI